MEGENGNHTGKAILRGIGGDLITCWLRLQAVWAQLVEQEGGSLGRRTCHEAGGVAETGRGRVERASPLQNCRRSVATERSTAHHKASPMPAWRTA